MAMRPSAFVLAICSATLVAICAATLSGSRDQLGVGRPPTADELKAIDIEVLPDGRGLPAGSGTAERGKTVYANRCVSCHGATGKEGPQDVLVGGQGTLASGKPLKTVGSYWPYATTLWDYINRAMPFDHPGTLPPDDVYATTAYLLYLNAIVGERDVMDATTLPRVQMPNRNGFVPDARPDVPIERPLKPRRTQR
jgi:S-disulfanyl-L-cysteine oxidoreductase SoxD